MRKLATLALIALVLAFIAGPKTRAFSSPVHSPLPHPMDDALMRIADSSPTATPYPQSSCGGLGWQRLADWMGKYPLWTDGRLYCVEGK